MEDCVVEFQQTDQNPSVPSAMVETVPQIMCTISSVPSILHCSDSTSLHNIKSSSTVNVYMVVRVHVKAPWIVSH